MRHHLDRREQLKPLDVNEAEPDDAAGSPSTLVVAAAAAESAEHAARALVPALWCVRGALVASARCFTSPSIDKMRQPDTRQDAAFLSRARRSHPIAVVVVPDAMPIVVLFFCSQH